LRKLFQERYHVHEERILSGIRYADLHQRVVLQRFDAVRDLHCVSDLKLEVLPEELPLALRPGEGDGTYKPETGISEFDSH
jgi:hypothetical protein